MGKEGARHGAMARLRARHIAQLADEIAARLDDHYEPEAADKPGQRKPKNHRPPAWARAVIRKKPMRVAAIILNNVVKPRAGDGNHPPSVVTVALSIAKQLRARRPGTKPKKPTPKNERVRIGVGLLHFAAKAGLIQPIRGPEAKKRDGERATPRVLLTEAALEGLAELTRQCIRHGIAADMFPLVEPPDPMLDPVRVKKNWRGKIKPLGPPPSYLPALEFIRRTPWKINECIYRTMREKLPDAQLRYAFRLMQHEGWRSLCKHKDRVIALEVAHDFIGKRFWLDVRHDYRGRIYHGGALRFNGADSALRPLLEFADGQVLTDDGAKYLAAYVAAQWQEKISATEILRQRRAFLESRSGFWGTEISRIDDLERWTLANEDLLLRVAGDPIKHFDELPQDEDARWYALAAADAWSRYLKDKKAEVHLPASWDAVASGLQVYALIMRDEELSAKVALTFASVGTFYDEIADECGETRKATKAVVMPWFYGSGEFASARALAKADRWAAAGDAAKVPWDAPEAAKEAAKAARKAAWPEYMRRANLLRSKAEGKAQALVRVRNWLQDDVAPVFSKRDWEICWTTPGGFDVAQDNHLTPRAKVQTMVDGERIVLSVRLPKGGLDPVKQKNSLPANVIHSLDATWLMATVLRGASAGIKSWGTVHDCFSVHPNDVGRLCAAYTSAAEDVFGDDYLGELHRQFQEQTRAHLPPDGVKIPEPPGPRGPLPLSLSGGREHLMP